MNKFLSYVGFIALSLSAQAVKHPGFDVSSIKIPTGQDPQVGGLDIMPNGKIVATFHEGDVRIYDPETKQWSLFASGLHEPLGLVAEDDHTVVIVQRPEITRISDTDGDGVADSYQCLCDDFGMSGNYHEFSFGPARDAEGNFYLSLNVASNGAPIREEIRGEWLELGLAREKFMVDRKEWGAGIKHEAGRMYSRVPYRGWVVKVDAKTGEMTPWASGFRSPNGLGFGPDGELYVSDNQGDWVGTSKLHQVKQGNFYGHPASLPWTEGYEGPDPVKADAKKLDEIRTPAAVWFTQSTMANSPSQPITIPEGFGEFGGQMLIGEMNKARIIRVILEEVNGVTQGACTPLIDGHGLDMGVNRFVFNEKNELIIGHEHLSWPGGEGMAIVSPANNAPYQDVKTINITADGFTVEFLQDVEDTAELAKSTLVRYTFDYHHHYGSAQRERENIGLTFTPVDGSKKKFTVSLDKPHKEDFCYEFNITPSYNPLLCYTVREIPAK